MSDGAFSGKDGFGTKLTLSIICIIITNTKEEAHFSEILKQGGENVIITLDTASSIPIYIQLRNQIIKGIGKGELKAGEKLPTVRQMAQDAGVNNMTVNKTYQILKTEGYIDIDRRKGATVRPVQSADSVFMGEFEEELELLSAEACLKGVTKKEFLRICETIFSRMNPCSAES